MKKEEIMSMKKVMMKQIRERSGRKAALILAAAAVFLVSFFGFKTVAKAAIYRYDGRSTTKTDWSGQGSTTKEYDWKKIVDEYQKQKEEERKKAEEEARKKAEEEARLADIRANGAFADENTYVLDLTTGVQTGSNISFFIISYESDGQARSTYVFPKAGDFAEGMEEFNSFANQTGVDAAATNREYMSFTDVVNQDPVGSTTILPLAENSNDQVVFHTKEKIDKITNVEFFTRYQKGGVNEWTCQGLKIYEVSRVQGIAMVGGFSKDYYANFTGKLLANVEFTNKSKEGGFYTFTWTLDEIKSFGGLTVKDENGKETTRDNPYTKLQTGDFGDAAEFSPGKNDKYGFRIDFADQPLAGLECEAYRTKGTLKGGEYIEDIALNINYTDIVGKPHLISLPVVTNALKWASDQGVDKVEIAGVAQAGQSLYFEGTIPGLASFTSVSLVTGSQTVLSRIGMSRSNSLSIIKQGREVNSLEDKIAISAFAIYHTTDEGVNNTVTTDGAFLSYKFSGLPILYQRAETEYGIEIPAGEDTTLQLTKPMKESDLSAAGWKEKKYLVGVHTDKTPRAGTVADVQMQLSYTDVSGYNQTTKWYSLKEEALNYYGYWYSENTQEGDFAYMVGMSPDNTLYYVVTAPNVDQFTNAAYKLESGSDEWQTNGLQIWALDSLSPIQAEWKEVNVTNTNIQYHSDVQFYREFDGINILNIQGKTVDDTSAGTGETADGSQDNGGYSYLPDSLLVQSGDEISWDFKTKGVTDVEEEQYASLGYEMTYEDCLQNFGFDKTRETYTVKVAVSDQAIDTSGNGDCGSENNFYFQLLFENGSSAVVLANQQLEGDRFRTGNIETFTIRTNKDYGSVTGVRIIPEQVQDASVPDDKLKVDEISVVRASGNSYNETYIVEQSAIPNNGWIGASGYMDDAQKHTTQEDKKGRMIDDIAIDLPITAYTNEINLLCCLSLEEYKETTSQFYGEMKMTVDYIKKDGTPAKETFDIVDAMYTYCNKAVQHDADTDSTGRSVTRQPAVSSPSLMFRGGHTDRFQISLRDCKSLYMVTLTGQSRGDTSEMNVSSISFSTVEEQGSLQLSGKDEYIHSGTTTYVTSNSVETNETAKLGNTFAKGQDQKIKISLLANEIAPRNEGSLWLAVFSREPVSQQDSLNIYIYPTTASMPIANYDLYTRATYSNVVGQQLTSALTLMNKHVGTGGTDRSYFYLNGLSAKQIATLDNLYCISGNQGSDLNAYIDYAVIQQVRSGTVINTWQKDGYNKMASMGADLTMQSENPEGMYNQQKVYLQLSDDSGTDAEKKLIAEKTDIAVALRYTSSVDPTEKEVDTPYIYITDQDYYRIQAGMMIELTFDTPYVKEVKGLKIAKQGDLNATIDLACVENYARASQKDEEGVLISRSNFVDELVVSTTPTTLEASLDEADVVKPLYVTFTTSPADAAVESGTSSPVRMAIGYGTVSGLATETDPDYLDISYFITDRNQHSFLTGETQEIRLLTRGIDELHYIDLEPYTPTGADKTTLAGWSLESVSAQLGVNGDKKSRSIKERIREGEPKRINFQNLTMSVTAFWENRAVNANETRTITDGVGDFAVDSNVSIRFRPVLIGSISDYDVMVERKVGDTRETLDHTNVMKVNKLSNNNREYVFTPARNYMDASGNGTNQVYYVTFESKENPEIKCVFTVTVQPEALEGTVSGNSTNTTTTDTSSTGSDTSDSGSDSEEDTETNTGSETSPDENTEVTRN